jgi:hypothetical protein
LPVKRGALGRGPLRRGALAAGAVAAMLGMGSLPASAAQSAAALYQQAFSTTKGWSVHYQSDSNVGNVPFLTSGDTGPASGSQEVLTKSGTTTVNAQILVIGGLTYLNGNAGALEVMIGLTPAQALATTGKWFVFSTTNHSFGAIVAGVRSHDVAGEVAVQGPYSLGTTRTLNGTRVIPIYGTQKLQGLKRMHVVLYVQATGKHQLVEEDTINAHRAFDGVLRITFSKWGESVRPKAPSASITLGPISTT